MHTQAVVCISQPEAPTYQQALSRPVYLRQFHRGGSPGYTVSINCQQVLPQGTRLTVMRSTVSGILSATSGGTLRTDKSACLVMSSVAKNPYIKRSESGSPGSVAFAPLQFDQLLDDHMSD